MPTKIRKEQIRIDEFIQALASVDWSSDTLTVSAAAILSKVHELIEGVSGAMLYRGAWSLASNETTIKAGYVYVYDGNGTAPTGVTLENGDTLIANIDSADTTAASNWTIVNVNITGAITTANLVTNLLNYISTGNANALTITNDTTNGKVKLTVNFPTVSNGSTTSGQYVSGISIDAITGVISVIKASLPTQTAYEKRIIFDETPTGDVNGINIAFTTQHLVASNLPIRQSLYINGIKQHNGTDVTLSIDSEGHGVFKLTASAYIPKSGDVVTCDYVSTEDVTA